jgi:hypothetical protein
MKKRKSYLPVTPEAQRICEAWAEIVKIELSPARVTEHLDMLERWERAKVRDLREKKAVG